MPITIYGAGAIGGLTGAYLARAAEDVLLVDKLAEHVAAMARHGLRISGHDSFTVPVRACLPEDLAGPLGLTLLAVKSQHTEDALDVLAPLVGPETIVVSMQNGMNPPRIAARIGAERVLGVFCKFGGDYLSPGHIEHGGVGTIFLGEIDGRITERVRRIESLLSHVLPVVVTDNLYGYLWAKQIYCSLLFAQAVSDQTTPDTMGNREYQPLLMALVAEGVAVARAVGVRLEGHGPWQPTKLCPRSEAEVAEARSWLDRLAGERAGRVKVRSGFWRDLAVRQRPTEVDHTTGWLIVEGEKLGLALPLNRQLVGQVKEIEQGRRQRCLENLAELDRHRRELHGASIGPA